MNPKVSIIIATYNSAKTLRTALDSVLNQSFQTWECIVVDGASKDDTIKIVEEYESTDARFLHISEPDKGIYDAFNKGWKIAKGEWIYYLGSDDELLKEGLESIEKHFNMNDIVYGNVIFKVRGKEKHEDQIPVSKLKGKMVSHQSIVMKKSLLEELGGFDVKYRYCADFDMFQRALLKTDKIEHVTAELAVFECGGASSGDGDALREFFEISANYGSIIDASTIYAIRKIKKTILKKLKYVK